MLEPVGDPSAALSPAARLVDAVIARCRAKGDAAAPSTLTASATLSAADWAGAWWREAPDDFLGVAASAGAPAGRSGDDDAGLGVAPAPPAPTGPAVAVLDAALASALDAADGDGTLNDQAALARIIAELEAGGETVAGADAGALLPIMRLLQRPAGGQGASAALAPSGALVRALAAALAAADGALRREALAVVRARRLAVLQVEVAALLEQPERVGHDGVEATLDALGELADGRVVRRLEAMLAARPAGLSDHQAWRARHVVQKIRRGGRR